MKQSTTTRLTVNKQFDYLNRFVSISSAPSASSALSFSYVYNDANQRTRVRLQDNSFWVYSYDALGQVVSGKKYWSDWTPVAGQQFEYGFDNIGNRTSTKAGGDETGQNLRSATYSANNLNQYTSRDIPSAFDVIGLELATNTVTVNSSAPYRKGEYFRKEVSVANSSAAVWQSVTVSAPNETTVNGNVFIPKNQEAFTYDLDGNLLSDGRFNYTWDAENRLTAVESLSTNPTGSKRKVVWEFDGKGRRIRQTTSDGSSGSYVVTEDLKFLADGWRHIAELNYSDNALLSSYLWGLDLSGSMDGAGGVGGLISINSAANEVHFAAYDGNGNVTGLIKASDGTLSANYEYDPFGQTLRSTGLMARENPFRFSTKRTSDATDLVLYEYRIFNPSTGRWLNPDPAGEFAGAALLAFVNNAPADRWDYLGLCGGGVDPFIKWCGPDATTATLRTLQEIESTYRFSWSFQQKQMACNALYTWPVMRGAWFIKDLLKMGWAAAPTPPAVQGTFPGCETTVTYNGVCHHAGDIHYLMWGKINKMCYDDFRGLSAPVSLSPWTLPTALLAAASWKFFWVVQEHDDPRYIGGALGFTLAGYLGQPLAPFLAGVDPYPNCTLRPWNKCPERRFTWQWLPWVVAPLP